MIYRPVSANPARMYATRGGSMVDIAKALATQLVPDVVEGALQMGRSGVHAITSKAKRKMGVGGDPASVPVPAKIRRAVARTQAEGPSDYDPFDGI